MDETPTEATVSDEEALAKLNEPETDPIEDGNFVLGSYLIKVVVRGPRSSEPPTITGIETVIGDAITTELDEGTYVTVRAERTDK